MPGFAGALRLDGGPIGPEERARVEAMGAAIAHRGLSQRALRVDGPLALLGAPSPEPEIFAFDGRSSQALALWRQHGEGLVEHLDGPFALAAWDGHTLTLARDHVGLRPLFTARADGLLLFGSEIKALLAHPACPREVDWLGALAYEALPRRDHPTTSWFLGIDPLEAGSLQRHGVAGSRTRRYWRLELPSDEALADDTRTDEQIIEGYREVLDRALTDALGDDPARSGLLLSGGIDSIALASLAARHAPIPTFTVLGQSTWGNGDARSAHRAASLLGLPEHPVLFRWREPIPADQWRRILWLCETPLCGPQHYYKFHLKRFATSARPELRRMLNGEGSDEYSGADFRNHGEAREGATWEDYLADLADKQREELHEVRTLGVEGWMGRPVFTRPFLARSSGRPLVEHPWRRRVAYVGQGMAGDVLWRDDRLAAGNGLAADAPFMDHRLLSYVSRIPSRAWGRLYWGKHLLREAMRGVVPEEVRLTPKIPFYGGRDARFTTGLLYDMLMAKDRALVREALGEGPHPVLVDGLIQAIEADCARDPQRGAAQVLLLLVNLGLLEKMAKDAASRTGPAAEIAPLPALETWDEAAIDARLSEDELSLDERAVLCFCPGVELVRRDTMEEEPASYIIVNDEIRYVLDEPDSRLWRAVLRRIDGIRPLGTILAELGARFEDVRPNLEEALSFGVLVAARG